MTHVPTPLPPEKGVVGMTTLDKDPLILHYLQATHALLAAAADSIPGDLYVTVSPLQVHVRAPRGQQEDLHTSQWVDALAEHLTGVKADSSLGIYGLTGRRGDMPLAIYTPVQPYQSHPGVV